MTILDVDQPSTFPTPKNVKKRNEKLHSSHMGVRPPSLGTGFKIHRIDNQRSMNTTSRSVRNKNITVGHKGIFDESLMDFSNNSILDS